MPLRATCIACGNSLEVTDERAGEILHCQICGGTFRVPAAPDADPFFRDPGLSNGETSLLQRLAMLAGLFTALACFIAGGTVMFAGAAPANAVNAATQAAKLAG